MQATWLSNNRPFASPSNALAVVSFPAGCHGPMGHQSSRLWRPRYSKVGKFTVPLCVNAGWDASAGDLFRLGGTYEGCTRASLVPRPVVLCVQLSFLQLRASI